MNSKKNKGKSKPNKPPNPNPPQKIEELGKDTENLEDVSVGDSAQKSDIRVPEIISELVTPAVEVKEIEEDSPKKPKRNRGKKKKHDKEEEENQDEKPTEIVDIIEIIEVETQDVLIDENVAPNVRKKKNKNKKVADSETKGTEKIEQEVPVTEQKKIQEIEVNLKEKDIPEDVAEQEVKISKKKNKKKKRNDSERSEKAEELSCTTAFQKLLKDDNTEVKTVENQPAEETKKQAENLPDIAKNIEKDLIENTALESGNTEKQKEIIQELPQTSMNEPGGKNKKKNKKDKKDHLKEKEIKDLDTNLGMPEMIPITSISSTYKETIENIEVVDSKIEKKPTEDAGIESSLVEDIKPKAKIAKPVEKKRKGKEDNIFKDLSEVSSPLEILTKPQLSKEEVKPEDVSNLEEIKTAIAVNVLDFPELKEKQTEISSVESQAKIMDTVSEMKSTEIIDLPEIDKNIKRKKSPKPGKQEQTPKTPYQVEIKTETHKQENIKPTITKTEVIESQLIKDLESHDAAITEAFEELIRIPESDKNKKRKRSPKLNKHDQKAKTIPETIAEPVIDQTLSSQEGTKPKTQVEPKVSEEILPLLATEIIEPRKEIEHKEPNPPVSDEAKQEVLPIIEDIKTDDSKFLETKSKKKRKKSPKLPLASESHTETVDTFTTSEISKTEEIKPEKDSNIMVNEELSQGKTDIFYNMPLAENIEIQSFKADESEGSTCGFTPDIIQHPRATSQDLIDDNNNTFIQEITVEEMKLQIPSDIPDTPFVQGSGETPLRTPECVYVGVKISEINVDAGKCEQEKTDIKSKMMEVNQDMEELRLSIERSLAELTAIEKSEDEKEKTFEQKALSTPDVLMSPESKISMPSELFKSQSEKMETSTLKEKKIEDSTASCTVDKLAEIGTSITLSFEKDFENKDIKNKLSKKSLQQQSTSAADIPNPVEKITEKITPPIVPARKDKSVSKERDMKSIPMKSSEDIVKPAETVTDIPIQPEIVADTSVPPTIPARKDHKNKGKNKKKGKQDAAQTVTQIDSTSTSTEPKETTQETTKKEEKTEQKTDTKQHKGKQHSIQADDAKASSKQEGDQKSLPVFEPIENFEDAMTSSADDINKTFEMIANDATQTQVIEASHVNPEIKIVAPIEDSKPDKKDEKINPVSPPKNLLGHPDIPVPSNRTDYKKEKNKAPNTILAKVKIKDAVQIENKKETKDTQTDNIRKFLKTKSIDESFSSVTNENDEFVYKYSFRKVFLQSACHVCKKELKQTRVPCSFCNLIFYCNAKHKDEDWTKHQGFCFAVSTIVHLKDQKHIYADSQNITGQDYRLLRMQMIVSCEKVLKRKLTPFEQEALLYPRVCASAACREWRQSKLIDCDGCGQISYCSDHSEHFPKTHQRWCKSYSLYQKLVCYQQTRGRLEPKLPSKIMPAPYQVTEKMNEVLAAMYEEKIDMNDIQYAALTQIATAPLTAAYCLQAYAKLANYTNGTSKKSSCTIHIVGGELQFEADALNKWEVFFLHLRPDLQELRVVMVGRDLNPSNLPLELLGKVKLCESCRSSKRRVVFSFQDKTTYYDYWASDDFVAPDIVCAFNPSIKRSSMYNGKDPWPKTVNCVLKLKTPFVVTAYTMNELQKDLARVKECSEVDHKTIIEPKFNCFASVRPDRNFISDDEMPLLFKNYCFTLIAGAN